MLTYIILDENDNKIPAIMTWHSTYSYQALIFTTKSALKGYFFSLLKEELQPLDKLNGIIIINMWKRLVFYIYFVIICVHVEVIMRRLAESFYLNHA